MLLFGRLGVNMKRCSVSLSFVDQEIYVSLYDLPLYDVTSNDVSVERHSDFELDPRMQLLFILPWLTTTNPYLTIASLKLRENCFSTQRSRDSCFKKIKTCFKQQIA